MKVVKIIEKVVRERFEGRIKLLEDELKVMKEAREREDKDEVSPHALNAGIGSLRGETDARLETLKKRVHELEAIHPTERDPWKDTSPKAIMEEKTHLTHHTGLRRRVKGGDQ